MTSITYVAKRSLLLGLGVLLAVVSTLAVVPAQPAAAAACRYYMTSTPSHNEAPADGEIGTWTYGATTSPNIESPCKDINLSRSSIVDLDSHFSVCAYFRVRYVNANGTPGRLVPQPTVLACTGSGNVVIAKAIPNGQKYRVETNAPVRFQIHD